MDMRFVFSLIGVLFFRVFLNAQMNMEEMNVPGSLLSGWWKVVGKEPVTDTINEYEPSYFRQDIYYWFDTDLTSMKIFSLGADSASQLYVDLMDIAYAYTDSFFDTRKNPDYIQAWGTWKCPYEGYSRSFRVKYPAPDSRVLVPYFAIDDSVRFYDGIILSRLPDSLSLQPANLPFTLDKFMAQKMIRWDKQNKFDSLPDQWTATVQITNDSLFFSSYTFYPKAGLSYDLKMGCPYRVLKLDNHILIQNAEEEGSIIQVYNCSSGALVLSFYSTECTWGGTYYFAKEE